jgi:hypothetical protein
MSDQGYLIPSPRPPWWKRISGDRAISFAALVVSFGAATFSFFEYRAADRQAKAAEDQARIAQAARDDAKQTAQAQAHDVERSRKASEDSAKAAQDLANAMSRSARAAEASAQAGASSLSLGKRALALSERPLLETLATKFLKPFPSEPFISLQTQTINDGKGPAYDINIWQGIQIAATYGFPIETTKISHTDILGAGGFQRATITVTSVMNRPLTESVVNDVKSKKLFLYVYGGVTYDSKLFEKPEAREPYTYCYYYAVPLEASAAEPFADCPQHPSLSELAQAPAK